VIAGLLRSWFDARTLLRFALSGVLGILAGFALYGVAYQLNPMSRYRATSSYIASYLVGIVVQHALHRWITFGNEVPYTKSLRRTFIVYPVVLAISSGVNLAIVRGLEWHHLTAFWVTVGLSGLLSFIGLRAFAFRNGESDGVQKQDCDGERTEKPA
jgi:putative flippase GtrA